MAQLTEGKVLTGIGWVYLSDGNYLDDYANFTITFDNKTLQWANSSHFGVSTMNIGRDMKGSIEFRKITSNVLHLLVGGSLTTGNAIKHYNEAFTVAGASPYTATLTNEPIITNAPGSLRIYSKDINDNVVYYEQVAAGSEDTGKYSVSGSTLTFGAGDAGASLYADYYYESADLAHTISLGGSADTLPTSFSLDGLLLMQTDGGAQKTLRIYAKNCVITSGIDLGGAVQAIGSVKANFAINVADADDVQITLED